jgi:RNase P/RNase MRP subunit POP5
LSAAVGVLIKGRIDIIMVHPYRRRYIVIHIVSPPGSGKGLIIKMIRERTKDLSEADFRMMKSWVVYFNEGWAIIKVSQEGLEILKGILDSMRGTVLRDGPFDFHSVGVSGTIRKSFQKYIPPAVRGSRHYHEDLSE